MAEQYISLGKRLQQIQQARQTKFNKMMQPVLEGLNQLSQLKKKEEAEGQQLNAIKNIYSEDIDKYGIDLPEYSKEEFGTPTNYEKLIRKKISSKQPEYRDRLKESKSIAQTKKDFIDAYGEEALGEIDINEQSTLADWEREVKQYGHKLEQRRTVGENRNKLINSLIELVGAKKAKDYENYSNEKLKSIISQIKYEQKEDQPEPEPEPESDYKLTNKQKQEIAFFEKNNDYKVKDTPEDKLMFLKYNDQIELLQEKLDAGEFIGIEENKAAEKRIQELKEKRNKHLKIGAGGLPSMKATEALSREEMQVFGMSRNKALGDTLQNKPEKKEKSWRDYLK
ncbi:MAG: hypothetical protein KGY74_08750 [Candidatus Cloacimonetes bacterium]|nr:hypothetical protein [Candidatus Cloacimonadota bacterium]